MHIIKFLNCLFLIIGTTIGTGILALPLTSPAMGFYPTLTSLVIAWGFMTISSFFLLRATMKHKTGQDLTTMAKKNLGPTWKIIIIGSYLLLLYALLTVYILVGSSWLKQLAEPWFSFNSSQYQMAFTLASACVIYLGVHFVGGINQILSAGVIICLIAVVTMATGQIELNNFTNISYLGLEKSLSVMVTTFGFAVILPTLASYTQKNYTLLKRSLTIASIIVLLLNALWLAVCFGVIGNETLVSLSKQNSDGPEIVLALQHSVKNSSVGLYAGYFAIFALLSSLIGVALSLYHFIIDSFNLKRIKYYKVNAVIITFTIPLLVLLINPTSFVAILGFAGIFVSVVLGILPGALEIKLHKKSKKAVDIYCRVLAVCSILFYCTVIIVEISKFY